MREVTKKTAFCILAGLVTSMHTFAIPKAPSGQQWKKVDILSDEFDDDKLDSKKWFDYHPHWSGREPSKFKKGNAYLEDGNLCLKSGLKKDPSTVKDPFKDVWVDAAACVSKERSAKVGYYYEAMIKASSLSMTSSFWFRVGDFSEIDVIEHIGDPSRNNRDNDLPFQYHANTHVYGKKSGKSKAAEWKMPTRGRDEYHLYGFWWKSPTELWFYHNNEKVMEITPSVPFDENLKMVFDTEVFPFASAGVANIGLPLVENLKDDKKNTMYVDYVRTYELKEATTTPATNVVEFTNLPTTMELSDSMTVNIAYTSAKKQQLTTMLLSPDGKWLAGKSVQVNAGSKTSQLTFSLPDTLNTTTEYKLFCDLRSIDGNWDDRVTFQEKKMTFTDSNSGGTPEPVIVLKKLTPVNDGYVQGTKGYNTKALKVENNRRTSYLQYDLSSIDGDITSMKLKLTVGSDPGNGTITVSNGSTSNWKETNLTSSSAPKAQSQLAQSTGAMAVGKTFVYDVTKADIKNKKVNFVLEMKAGGNDVLFNSKEASTSKPTLEVSYDTSAKESPAPAVHTVTFISGNGKKVAVTVTDKKAAKAPTPVKITGKTFVRWDKDYSKVTKDLTVTAVYAVNRYAVVFNAGNRGEFSTNSLEYTVTNVKHGSKTKDVAPINKLLVDPGYLFNGWNTAKVTRDYQVVTAKYKVDEDYAGDESKYDWATVSVPADPGSGKKWKLQESFSDDFNYLGKNKSFDAKWKDGYFKGWKGPGLTYWESDHSEVLDGSLLIMASRKKGTKKVNCGVVTSKEKVMYPVYMEARIKVSNLELSSNFWMLSEDDKREIDVLEVYGGASNKWFAQRMSTNFHVFLRDKNNKIKSDYNDQTHNTLPGKKLWRNDFHTFGVYWKSPTEVSFYIDGDQTPEGSWQQAFMKDKDYTGATMNKNRYTMDRPMYMIIDTEDHSWRSDKGIIAKDKDLKNDAKNIMYVDWVRTYKPVNK